MVPFFIYVGAIMACFIIAAVGMRRKSSKKTEKSHDLFGLKAMREEDDEFYSALLSDMKNRDDPEKAETHEAQEILMLMEHSSGRGLSIAFFTLGIALIILAPLLFSSIS
jgi:hypothetical protein